MKSNVELMCLYWTTAGVIPGRGEISPFDFKDRVEAAAKAGFKGIGLWHTDLEHVLVHRSLKEMKQILDDHGMKYLELEFLTDWFLEGGRKTESDNRKKRLFEASQALHAKHVKIGDFYNSKVPLQQVMESFAALCREAQAFEARIGFEIMGCAVIDNIKDAIAMVTGAGAENGGLILDMYQVANLGLKYEDIRCIPLQYLLGVELDDGTLPGNPQHDPANRRFCGEGEYDTRGLVRCMQAMGYGGPWAVEIISEKVVEMPLLEAAYRAYQTTMKVFEGNDL